MEYQLKIKKKQLEVIFDKDAFSRPDTTLDVLSSLKPVFKPNGTVTAGNSSDINDGAAALVITTENNAERLGFPILCYIKGFATAGYDPKLMGYTLVISTRKLMVRYKLTADDFDIVEFMV